MEKKKKKNTQCYKISFHKEAPKELVMDREGEKKGASKYSYIARINDTLVLDVDKTYTCE